MHSHAFAGHKIAAQLQSATPASHSSGRPRQKNSCAATPPPMPPSPLLLVMFPLSLPEEELLLLSVSGPLLVPPGGVSSRTQTSCGSHTCAPQLIGVPVSSLCDIVVESSTAVVDDSSPVELELLDVLIAVVVCSPVLVPSAGAPSSPQPCTAEISKKPQSPYPARRIPRFGLPANHDRGQ
jgi:hypothetical protein